MQAYQTTRDLVEATEADAEKGFENCVWMEARRRTIFLMQFQADILGKRIVRPADLETTALGAAYLAGLATGFFRGLEQVEEFWRAEKVFEPRMSAARREELYTGWRSAIARRRYRE